MAAVSGTTVRLPDPAAAIRLLRLLPGNRVGIGCGKEVSLLAREDGDWQTHRLEGATYSGPRARVFLDAKFLSRALQFGMSELRIGDAHAPVIFTGSGRLIVMPMRVSEPPARKH